jgi:hypothetical protein
MSHSLTSSVRICASRFCSTTKTCSWAAMKSTTPRREGEGAHAQRSRWTPPLPAPGHRLVHRRAGGAVIDHADASYASRRARTGPGTRRLGGLELAQQPLHVVDVTGAFLAVLGVAVARGAAGEIGALARMRAGIGAVGNAVAVDVEVAAEVLAGFQLSASSPCRGHSSRLSSQAKGAVSRSFMPMSRSSMTKTGVCSRSARSKACAPTRSTPSGLAGTAARAWCRRGEA